jgi:hypothetical protein
MMPTAMPSARRNTVQQIREAPKVASDALEKSGADIAVIRFGDQVIARLPPNVNRCVPRGTGAEAGAKTGALPEIRRRDAQLASPYVGGACKGCDETFKGDK